MGINSTEVSYGFGQMGSGLLTTAATSIFAPKGKVIVAITMLEDILFDQLVADTSYKSLKVNTDGSYGDGVAYFGTGSQTRANGLDNSDDSVERVAIGTAVSFPKGLTIYGRWTSVDPSAASTTGGMIFYFGH